ncbi:hypothetical protein FOQG_09972 [Fusarium oxysporum f. sp. raphani 54005]|uniref:Uncharacterized protein n=11 Tax=Fusarium oxysporum TaxID=5507 RepID=W9HRP2_FUSOX|nr:hypothetical protein FOXG_21296 [Fusarium oxysporum f. sp. lycopersici 4287]EWY84957.1 hypothetical protein FOYG_12288 [Fusarium oxysporum NRRL 32931]EWZ35404.1 hypothetical protein FOZG_11362 [Fusarium oxysporum Fo47]EWZ96601.1 hypothetical protein FOWG_03922 [Fusarium oxysporum f. sp. lycopersici MN25]EXA37533.1 hypothetical protein FOVG_11718 [Fusarium oxysporum f. sp. pisi HDV247]EXK35072.1 hypothetical protein FOMG_10338 [Fusarium oxysporum f. sp. melonis 26406]EXK86298.1 hypothetical
MAISQVPEAVGQGASCKSNDEAKPENESGREQTTAVEEGDVAGSMQTQSRSW